MKKHDSILDSDSPWWALIWGRTVWSSSNDFLWYSAWTSISWTGRQKATRGSEPYTCWCHSFEMLQMFYLLSGSSLHSQFLWPWNCTCPLITDPDGRQEHFEAAKWTSGKIENKKKPVVMFKNTQIWDQIVHACWQQTRSSCCFHGRALKNINHTWIPIKNKIKYFKKCKFWAGLFQLPLMSIVQPLMNVFKSSSLAVWQVTLQALKSGLSQRVQSHTPTFSSAIKLEWILWIMLSLPFPNFLFLSPYIIF